MEDPETKSTFVGGNEQTKMGVRIFKIPCRLQNDSLKAHEIPRLCTVVLCMVGICGLVTLFMREPIGSNGFNMRIIPVAVVFISCVQYGIVYLNLVMGGWGAENGRFWCDVKIMFVRGFNTVRTLSHFFSNTLLFLMLAFIFGSEASMLYISLLVIIAEWQTGIVENQNQYDQAIHEKFINEKGELCFESLQLYQFNHPSATVVWSPFVIACSIKTYVITCILVMSHTEFERMTFSTPISVCIILWGYILPSFLNFVYLKNAFTFCQLELYRTVSDAIFLPLIMMFSLV
jgi:hypothetical protein